MCAVLAAPAAAQYDPEEPGAPAQKAREAIAALEREPRAELKKMYRKYAELVAAKREKGWGWGVLSEAVIAETDDPFRPARLLEEGLAGRQKDADRLEKAVREPVSAAEMRRRRRELDDARADLLRLKKLARREMGVCRDWSDAVWSMLEGLKLEHWTARDDARRARPYHTAAIACAPAEDPTVCLAFDPWEDGRPGVYAFRAWDEKEPGGRLPAKYFLHELNAEDPPRAVER